MKLFYMFQCMFFSCFPLIVDRFMIFEQRYISFVFIYTTLFVQFEYKRTKESASIHYYQVLSILCKDGQL